MKAAWRFPAFKPHSLALYSNYIILYYINTPIHTNSNYLEGDSIKIWSPNLMFNRKYSHQGVEFDQGFLSFLQEHLRLRNHPWRLAYQGPYLYYFWIYGVHAFIWNDFSPTKTWGSSNSFGYSFWTILPFENPFGCNKIAKKYQTSWHTRSTKPNKPSRLISPPDQPEPSDATDPQDPPEPSSQLWRFSHNFTIVNLLLPKLLPTAHGWEQGAR